MGSVVASMVGEAGSLATTMAEDTGKDGEMRES